MKPNKDKLFVVKKYIMAKNASEAIRKDKTTPVDDVWVDEDFKKKSMENLASAIGFNVKRDDEDL